MSTTTDALRTALADLAAARESDRLIRETLAAAQMEFEAANAELFAEKAAAKTLVAAAEAQVRALALVIHDTTGETKPATGASVVMTTRYLYDKEAAMAWARVSLPTAISEVLDTKVIDKIASTGALPFATKDEIPAVRIATDLSAYLVTPEPVATAPEDPFA